MSSGHHTNYHHSAALEQELQGLLRERDIQAYLLRPHKLNFVYRVPFTGGSSVDGKTYYGDSDIPKNLRRFVMWHERTEKAFRVVKDMSYARAHELATCAEKRLVEQAGLNWDQYKRQIGEIVRKNEGESNDQLPPDLDPSPYRESGKSDLLARNKKAAPA